MTRSSRPLRLAAVATTAALMTSACTSDPAFWDAVALGLDEVAADMAWETANCYWATPPGNPYGVAQQYCPGSYGYQTPVTVYVDRPHRDHRRGEHRRRDPDRPRDRNRKN